MGDWNGAWDCLWEGLALRGQIAEDLGTIEARRDYAMSNLNLADVMKKHGALDESVEFYAKNIEILEQLLKETGTWSAKRDLRSAYAAMGSLEDSRKNYGSAVKWLAKGADLAKQVADESGRKEDKHFLMNQYSLLAVDSEDNKDLDAAREWFQKAFDVSCDLLLDQQSEEACRDQMDICNWWGNMEFNAGNVEPALKQYGYCIDIMRLLLEWDVAKGNIGRNQYIEDAKLMLRFYRLRLRLDKKSANGSRPRRREYWYRYLELSQEVFEETGETKDLEDFAYGKRHLAELEKADRHYDTAVNLYKDALRLYQQAKAKPDHRNIDPLIADIRKNLADLNA